MSDIVNPYIAGNPVTGSEMFFGREDVFQFVSQSLIGQHRDNVIVIYGQQRTGKTSILYQMHSHLDTRYLCIFIDLHGFALESLGGFLWELATQIVRVLRRDYQIDFPHLNRADFMVEPRNYFESEFLHRVWSTIGNRHVLLMIDEAIRLQEQVHAGKLEQHIFEYMRHLMQHYEQLNFLFSLGSGLEEMEREYTFLFSIGLYKKISFLDRNSANALITQPVKDYYQVTPAAQERIFEITSGHPYYTQLLCHSLFNRWQQQRVSHIEVSNVDEVLNEVVERGLAVLKHVWGESTPGEKAVMAAMAAVMGESSRPVEADTISRAWASCDVLLPKGEMAKAIRSLIAREIIVGQDKYMFTVDLQRLWVQKYRRLEWVKEEVTDAIWDWLSSPTISLSELPPVTGPLGQRPPLRMPVGPPPAVRRQHPAVPPLRRRRRLLMPLLILLLLLTIFGVTASLFAFQGGPPSPTLSSNNIIVTHAPDGESIGISDGTLVFDTLRKDGNLKLQAAGKLKAGNVAGAEALWEQAIANDTNDAEALIYLEDQRVLASHHSYITLVIGTVLTGTFTDTGRASLQGAYVAQKEYNDQCLKLPSCTPVHLLVANSGSGDSSNSGVAYASLVMEQIVNAARVDKTIVGVMGWPLSSSSLYVNTILGSTGIPVVSPTASIAPPPPTPPYFFSVAPSIERQGSVGAQYAEQRLRARRVALFVDPFDPYSESLANAFSRQFTADGNAIVDTENYTVGKSDTIPLRLPDALNSHPDLIYFAGYANDLGGLLTYLPACGPSACLQVLGGDALYKLTGAVSAPLNLYRLHFTAYAYPGEGEILAPSAQHVLAFYSEYPEDFDPLNQHAAGTYGYKRPDSGVMLSYDAIQTLLNASSIAFNFNGGKQSITPDDMQQALAQITGLQAWQGASGRISFGLDGTPTNKVVVLLHWSRNGQLQFDQAYGCFLKPLPTATPNPACG